MTDVILGTMAKEKKLSSNSKRANTTAIPQKTKQKAVKSPLEELDEKIRARLNALQLIRDGRQCYPFLLYSTSITDKVVEDAFDELSKHYKNCNGRLDVLVFSSGGDIDAAYNLALLFRKFASNELTFIIGRWAKSAATLLVCGGNRILMSPIAELGPIDPQITEVNPLEKRVEHFSPLHIEATLNLIRDEFSKGNEKLAKGLLERLQFPLTLGSFQKSLDIGVDYVTRLLSSRMLTGNDKDAKAKEIASKLTSGYADHGFCIDSSEAKSIGLNVDELSGDMLDVVWDVHKLCREKEELKAKQKRKEMEKMLKNLPPELREAVPTQTEITEPDSNTIHK
jgi:hypothetical protein